ncbi:hypothetical protein V8D89_008280 [Ganoderma adspersum]
MVSLTFALVRQSLVSCCAFITWVCFQSDIFELDEEEIQLEFEISPTLPSTPTSTCSTVTSPSRSVKSRMKTIFVDLAHTLRTKLNCSRPPKIYMADVESRTTTSTTKLPACL